MDISEDRLRQILREEITNCIQESMILEYAVPRKEPDYTQSSISADLIDRFNDKISSSTNNKEKKEENES